MTHLTRADELFIASQLQHRIKRLSTSLARNTRKPLHPEFVKRLQADRDECVRIASLLAVGSPSASQSTSNGNREHE